VQVLVVTGDPGFAEWLEVTLAIAGWLVRTATSADSSLALLGAWPARLVITDQRAVPVTESWVAGCQRTGARFVVVTPWAVDGQLEVALGAGADGFVQCPVGSHELIARLRAIDRRGPVVTPLGPGADATIELGALLLDRSSGRVTVGGRAVELEGGERLVLEALMAAAPRVVTRDELVRCAHRGGSPGGSLDVLVRRIRTRLEAEEDWRRIETVRGVGFRALTGPPSSDRRPAFTAASATGHEPFGPPREPVSP
jgi:DNA-binding response OmpR family regulator